MPFLLNRRPILCSAEKFVRQLCVLRAVVWRMRIADTIDSRNAVVDWLSVLTSCLLRHSVYFVGLHIASFTSHLTLAVFVLIITVLRTSVKFE